MTLVRVPELVSARASSAPQTPPVEIIFGSTPAMLDLKRRIELIAATDVPVLLQGESGTGKELCAQLIHTLSRRNKGALIKVSCPAIPQMLLETELFGYERGAFSGANYSKRGRVEQAHRGTLVLDEVGSLDFSSQSKLLQVLQDGTFMRVGGHGTMAISTRLISISNKDLRSQVEKGTFRLDFLYRINAVTLNLLPLRQRRADVPQLVKYFVRMHSRAFHVPQRAVSKGAMQMLQAYDWPGNIRQLDNLIRNYVLIGNEDLLVSELTPRSMQGNEVSAEIDVTKPLSLKQITKSATRDLERQIILKVLQANSWNRQRTAKWLQISYRSLLYKLSEAGIHEHHERPENHEQHGQQEQPELDAQEAEPFEPYMEDTAPSQETAQHEEQEPGESGEPADSSMYRAS